MQELAYKEPWSPLQNRMHDFFLSLIRLGIGKASSVKIPEKIDWQALEDLAAKQGLSAIIVDGIERLPENQRPPKGIILEWIGEVLQGYEYRYNSYLKTIADIAGFYNSHGYKMMLLKGYACSMDWPKPNHRPCGDIDIWLFGKQKDADELLAEKGIKVDNSHHHHSVFVWGDFSVENHYDFINVYHHKSHVKLEKLFKELGMNDSHSVEVNGEKVYLPSPNLHALFLLKHTMLHFVSGEITLRQLLDWAFFVEKHSKEIDWNWLENILEKYGMTPLYQLFNAICVCDLSFEEVLFPVTQYNIELKNKVLNEIINSQTMGSGPKNLLSRMFFRFRRWRANDWKHHLCYKESMWSAFWSGVWGHLLKPKSL